MFGLYKGGKCSSVFDKCMYLSLYTGMDEYEHKRVTLGDSLIQRPRISIFTADVPSSTIAILDEEVKQSDGFISRFLLFCPEAVFFDLSNIYYKHFWGEKYR